MKVRRFVRGLRREARARAGRDGALGYLVGLKIRVVRSGQDFALIPGWEIMDRAIRIERRRARVRRMFAIRTKVHSSHTST